MEGGFFYGYFGYTKRKGTSSSSIINVQNRLNKNFSLYEMFEQFMIIENDGSGNIRGNYKMKQGTWKVLGSCNAKKLSNKQHMNN